MPLVINFFVFVCSDEDFKLNEKDEGRSSGSDDNSDSEKDGADSEEDSGW